MTVETTAAAELAVEARVCGGSRCPMRSTDEHRPLSLDYCEGCPSTLRLCPGCHEYRPQTGWWFGERTLPSGLLIGQVAWCCADCRFDVPDRVLFAEQPDFWSDHPGLRGLADENPTFEVEFELSPIERPAVAAKLAEGGDELLARMAAVLRDPGFAGRLVVDVAEFPFSWRWKVPAVLGNAANRAQDQHSVADGPLRTLARLWEGWLSSQLPDPVEPVSAAVLAERETAARRSGRERSVT